MPLPNHLELVSITRELVECVARQRFLEHEKATVHCNWTSPDDWTCTPYGADGVETSHHVADTWEEAVDKARYYVMAEAAAPCGVCSCHPQQCHGHALIRTLDQP